MRRKPEPKPWERYEILATQLLNSIASEFDVDWFEGKQSVPGSSGTAWEIDAKGVVEDGEGFIVVECRKTKSRQSQAKVGALAFTLIDTGASAGILVSPMPLQRGAQKIAKASRIHHVQLDANSTSREFVMKFLDKLFMGVSDTAGIHDDVVELVRRACSACGRRFEAQGFETRCPTCELSETPSA